MINSPIKFALAFALLACGLAAHADAQLFRNMTRQRSQRSQTPIRDFLGDPNTRTLGILPTRDTIGRSFAGTNRIRDNRILSDGSMQWAPNNRHSSLEQSNNQPQPRYQPAPVRAAPNPYVAGPSVGARVQYNNQPAQKTGGWQPWMHVPLDGSQPWQ